MDSETLDRKLEQARKAAEGYGQKRGLAAVADDYLKGKYAEILELAPEGTVAERDAWVRRHMDYKEAIAVKRDAYADWETARLYMQILFAEAEKYRTDEATNRAMDRAHR